MLEFRDNILLLNISMCYVRINHQTSTSLPIFLCASSFTSSCLSTSSVGPVLPYLSYPCPFYPPQKEQYICSPRHTPASDASIINTRHPFSKVFMIHCILPQLSLINAACSCPPVMCKQGHPKEHQPVHQGRLPAILAPSAHM